MHAAAQHFHGTIAVFPKGETAASRRVLRPVTLPIIALSPSRAGFAETALPPTARMSPAPKPREFFIQGITRAGKTFRPSDWSERLAGALSSFRPKSGQHGSGIGAHIGYSPYCAPRVIEGVKCVIVNEALRDLEPMAWDFVMNFARDNDLQVVEACLLPESPAKPSP
jgi:hypothetical protein